MKLAIGSKQIPVVVDQLVRWFPARETVLRKLQATCVMGLQIDLAPLKRAATEPQRGLYWRSIHTLGAELGYSAHEAETLLHEVILSECFGTSGVREIKAGGTVYRMPIPAERSTRDADGVVRDVETYSALIETLLRVAAEQGVVLEVGK